MDALALLRGDGGSCRGGVEELPEDEATGGEAVVKGVFAVLDGFGADDRRVGIISKAEDELVDLLPDLWGITHHVALYLVRDDEVFLLRRHGGGLRPARTRQPLNFSGIGSI